MNIRLKTISLLIFTMILAVSCGLIEEGNAEDNNAVYISTENADDELILVVQTESETNEAATVEEIVEYIVANEINPRYDEYLKVNPDIVGNIKIDGTIIDFPVVYSGENDYYLKHDIYGNETKYGAIFMEMLNRGAILDRNTIIHGHNFKGHDNSMFADLEKYKNKEFFDTHKTVIFNNLYADMEWEVFAVYVVGEENNKENYYLFTTFQSEEDYFDFVELIRSKAIFWSDYEPKAGDYMLTLHTCSYEFENAHTMVHARLVKKSDNVNSIKTE